MKDNNELLSKVSHNKILLFIVPNLIYIYKLCYYYNSNFDIDHILEVSFREVIFVSLIFFLITWFVYFMLKKIFRDNQKIFCIMCFICYFYFFKFTLIQFLLFIVAILILIIDFKKLIKFKLDSGVCLVSFIIIALFCTSFLGTFYNCCVNIFRSKSYDNDISIKVDSGKDTPNIYYFHCDGMLGIRAMRKYFYYNDTYLTDYLEDNNYYLNEEANFVNGHKTQRALVALFNPYYYDNFFREYLDGIEDYYIKGKASNTFNVGYYELEDKRLDNELFRALKRRDYTTVGIGEFNKYTSLDTDYYYDYYFYNQAWEHLVDGKEELRYINDSNSDFKINSYLNFLHSKVLLSDTMFGNLIEDFNYLDYDEVDYQSFDTSDYEYINNSKYWVAKAILKGLDETMDMDRKFVFIDYNLNHLNLTFDRYGNRLSKDDGTNLNYYVDNYIYSSYLLVDMLEFIKDNDKDAVIIIEGDHGIHMLEDEYLMNRFSTNMNGVQEIRNSVISAIYIPDKYKSGDEEYLDNPLNISRYLVNSYVGEIYEYLK